MTQKEKKDGLPEGWKEVHLGSLLKERGYIRGPFGSALKRDEMKKSGIPVYEQANAIKNHREFRYYIDENKYKELKRFTVEVGDLVISCSGTLGRITQIKENDPVGIISQALLILRANLNKININYLNYYLGSREGQYKLMGASHGSVQVNIAKRSEVEKISFFLPPLPTQKQVAKILSSFDEKIELLREQNETLEKIGQEIFKEWFGKYKIGDELPEGWRVGKLSEVADFLNGLALQKFPPIEGKENLPVIKIREIKQGITDNTDQASSEIDNKYIIQNGDVLFSWSGSLEVVIWKYGKGALNQHLFKVTSKEYPKWFYYHWTLYYLKNFQNIAAVKATTMGHINRKHLDEAIVFIPNQEIMEKVGNNLAGILEKIENNNLQIQTLSKTRDTLLPKLMRGEVLVNDL